MNKEDISKSFLEMEEARKLELPMANFVDWAVRILRLLAREADECAQRPGANAQDVVAAIKKYIPDRVKDFRDAAHRPVPDGAGPHGLGLKFPTPDEEREGAEQSHP